MSRSSHGDDSDRTSESSELVIDKNNGLKEEAPTRTLPLLQPKIRRHRPNPPTLFPIQVDPYCNDLRSTTRYEMNDNSCAIEPPHDLLCKHENRVLPTKMSPHFLRTLTLRSNDSNKIITDTKQDAPSGSDDVKLIAQDLDIFSPHLSEPSEIYGDLCRVSFQLSLSPDDGNTKKPASSITNQQFVYSSPSHIARHHLPCPAPRQRQNSSRSLFDMSNDPPVSSITIKPQNNSQHSSPSHFARHHLPYPAPIQRQNSSRSLFDMSNDPLDWILRADAIAEAERMNEPLTDDEEDNDNEGVDANFFLRLPSVDETNRVVSNNSCLLEEDKSSSKMSISLHCFKTPPPSTV